ncbi:MAG: hypothetical protein ACPLKP_03325 [Microgenomates group bacterium]
MKKRILITFIILLILGVLSLLFKPQKPQAASLTNVSATLSNSRLSFYGVLNGAVSAGATAIKIKTSGNYADKNTNHLFPNDTVSVGPNGGKTVASIIDDDDFVLTSGLTVGASDGDPVYATQSSQMTVSFTLNSNIPANGYVLLIIPDPPSNGNDGAPDTASSTTDNGFDLNGITAANISTSGGTGCTWSTETVTPGTGNGHRYKVKTTSECTGGTITITVGDGTVNLVNPAPVYSGHTQGTADVYTVSVYTYAGDPDGGGALIDSGYARVAPVEAVLVSATVEETLTFIVSGVSVGTTACGQVMDVTTYPYAVPWGTLSQANTFKEAAQKLEVSTNANNGYTVVIEENDQMGLNGKTCTGANAGEADDCIKDTTCDNGSCTEATSAEWNTATNNGLGYSLANISGTDAVFTYNESGRTFSAKQIADREANETRRTIMSNSGPVNSKQIYVCYRISISGTQPAGYYYNKVKYTATPVF